MMTLSIASAAHCAISAVGIAALLEQRQIDKFLAQWNESTQLTLALVMALLLFAVLIVYAAVAYHCARTVKNRFAQTCACIPTHTQARLCNLAILVYILLILHFLLFSRSPNATSAIQLVPFQWYDGVWHESRVISAMANTALFVPFGFLLCCKRISLRNCFFALLGASLFCEIAQYITLRGSFKTENLILAVLGGCIGWFLCGRIKLYLFAK